MMAFIGFILSLVYVIWLSRLISFGVHSAARIVVATEASAVSLAVLAKAIHAREAGFESIAAFDASRAAEQALRERTLPPAGPWSEIIFPLIIGGGLLAFFVGIILVNR